MRQTRKVAEVISRLHCINCSFSVDQFAGFHIADRICGRPELKQEGTHKRGASACAMGHNFARVPVCQCHRSNVNSVSSVRHLISCEWTKKRIRCARMVLRTRKKKITVGISLVRKNEKYILAMLESRGSDGAERIVVAGRPATAAHLRQQILVRGKNTRTQHGWL